ncbi:hypothetical protein E4U61_003118 [Claviceps capensis]|nr:hypothetical protein E4U61_003118 [Claviceps capensis]
MNVWKRQLSASNDVLMDVPKGFVVYLDEKVGTAATGLANLLQVFAKVEELSDLYLRSAMS